MLRHRGTDQHADLGWINTRRVDSATTSERGCLIEGDAIGPPPALFDTGELSQQSGTQTTAIVGRRELLIDPVGGDDLGGFDRLDRNHPCVLMAITRIPAQRGCSDLKNI